MSFPTKYFDLKLPTNGGVSIALIGASRSGKTTVLKYLHRLFFRKHITTFFTMNPHAPIYKSLSDQVIVGDKFHGELLHDAYEINKLTSNKYDFLFVSDDYVDHTIKNDPEILRALTIYRNAGISTIFSFQGRTLMNSVGRGNVNYVFIFKQQTPQEFENVIKEYLSMWLPSEMNMREMVAFVMSMTTDHHFFFIDNVVGECYLSRLSPEQFEFAEQKTHS